MKDVYILSACRTPIGKFGGNLSSFSAVELGTIAAKEAIKRANINCSDVDHVVMGCVLQAGLGQNPARQVALNAGMPFETTAKTLNLVCGSGLESVNEGARLIQTGEADIVVAGGMESMSNAPFLLPKARFGYKMGSPFLDSQLIDAMIKDGLWDAFNDYHMGITAENVASKWNLTRVQLDEFALLSQQKTQKAMEKNYFANEIVPITIKTKREEIVVDKDEGPRPNLTMQDLQKLKPSFKLDGCVTPGNSSGLNDGAACVVLISENKLKELNLKPMAKWLGGCLSGVDPAIMGCGPIASTTKLLNRLNLKISDMDLVEANEAFAAQSIVVAKELGIDENILNVNGGAIALGHPIGASGCRILTTLLYSLKRLNKTKGLATLCVGGGMGCSTIIENCKENL